jgi:hypothetical protein
MLVQRTDFSAQIKAGLQRSPVTALLGPRQCGKTTLARQIAAARDGTFFDLENPVDEARLQNPQLVLEPLKGVVVLDEIQRRPDLLPLLRVLADRRPLPCRFLVLGSASPELIRGASESLAGRVQFVDLTGFTLAEVGAGRQDQLWLRGGFPDSFLARRVGRGARTSSAPSWSGTFPSLAARFRRPRCAASGRCWRTITARFGTARRSALPRFARRGVCGANSAGFPSALEINFFSRVRRTKRPANVC